MTPVNCGQLWGSVRAQITDVVVLNDLSHMDTWLAERFSETELMSKQFDELQTTIKNALEVIQTSELPFQLKDFFSANC